MKTNTTADIMHLSIAINNLNQVKGGDSAAVHVNRGQLLQLQNELDVKLEILRVSGKAPKRRSCA